jgi:hypothetical protein
MSPKKLSKDVIKSWPEVFGDINFDVVPVEYLEAIEIRFKDKKVWLIKVKNNERDWQILTDNIYEIFMTYQKTIDTIDFKLNTRRLKKDVIQETTSFLKGRDLN